jgi:hypothetical protein
MGKYLLADFVKKLRTAYPLGEVLFVRRFHCLNEHRAKILAKIFYLILSPDPKKEKYYVLLSKRVKFHPPCINLKICFSGQIQGLLKCAKIGNWLIRVKAI